MKTVTHVLLTSWLSVIFAGGMTASKSPTNERWQFQEFTSEEIRQQAREKKIVLIPVAQIENHGVSLPVGTDQFLAAEICERAARKSGTAIVGPSITLGNCSDFAAWPGYVVVTNNTFLSIVGDYLTSLKQQGFEKAVFFLMHGGHNFNTLDIAVSEMNRILKMKVHIVSIDHLFSTFQEDVAKIREGGVHPEVAMMLTVKPELVKKHDRPEAPLVPSWPALMRVGRYYDPGYTLDKIAPRGLVSYSERATPGIGEMLLDRSSTALSEEVLNKMND
jgi:creatinine amidohydrolase